MAHVEIRWANVSIEPGIWKDLWLDYKLAWNQTAATMWHNRIELPKGSIVPFTTAMLVIVPTVTAAANVFILYMIASHKSLQTSIFVILFGLLLSELLSQWFVAIGTLYYLLADRNETVCAVVGFAAQQCIINVVELYVQLAVNRYIAFFYSHLFERIYTVKKTIVIVVLTWLASAAIFVPIWPFFSYDPRHYCGPDVSLSLFGTIYMGVFDGLNSVFSIAVLLYCNIKVSRFLDQRKALMQERAFKSHTSMETFANVKKLLYFHAIGGPCFVMPLVVTRFIPGIETFPWVGRAAVLLMGMEPCVTPYVLIFLMKPIREAATAFLKRRFPALVAKVKVAAAPLSRLGESKFSETASTAVVAKV